jgi:hypothetical protein
MASDAAVHRHRDRGPLASRSCDQGVDHGGVNGRLIAKRDDGQSRARVERAHTRDERATQALRPCSIRDEAQREALERGLDPLRVSPENDDDFIDRRR